MATVDIYCESVGAFDAWTNVGGADKVASVDPRPSHDDDTTRIDVTITVSNVSQSFVLAGRPEIITLNSWAFNDRSKASAASSLFNRYWRLAGTWGGAHSANLGTSYATSSLTSNPPRPGGGSWTKDDLGGSQNAIEMRVEGAQGNPRTFSVTSLWATLDAEVPAGMSILAIIQWLGPVLGAGLTLRDAAWLARLLPAAMRRGGQRAILRPTPAEVLADWRTWRAPRVFDLAA